MKTTKTSEAIAKRMRMRGYNEQNILWRRDGLFTVFVAGTCTDIHSHRYGCYFCYENTANTPTIAYRDIEQRWKEGGK